MKRNESRLSEPSKTWVSRVRRGIHVFSFNEIRESLVQHNADLAAESLKAM